MLPHTVLTHVQAHHRISEGIKVTISQTFYEQLICQYSLKFLRKKEKKLSRREKLHKTFAQKTIV